MTGLEIAALVAMVGGAYMQNKAQQDAATRQQRAMQESLIRQQNFQREAEQTAVKKATEFSPDERLDKQQSIEQQLTTEMLQPVQENAAIRTEAPSVQGDVSDDYSSARATSMAEQAKAAEALARMFGKIGSATQLRRNEAVGLGDTANKIGMLSNFSQNQLAADQVGIEAAGVPSGGAMLTGSILQGVGQMGLMGAFDGLGSAGGGSSVWSGNGGWSGASPVQQTNNVGLSGKGSLGFKNFGSQGLRF